MQKNQPLLFEVHGSDQPLGQQQVQGVDYAYTLQGWLKGVNGISLDTARDIGYDGSRTLAARDAYGFQLNYYAGDYRPIQGSSAGLNFPAMSTATTSGPNYLFNGNISSMAVNIGVLGQGQVNSLLPQNMVILSIFKSGARMASCVSIAPDPDRTSIS